jgi:putative membrane protein
MTYERFDDSPSTLRDDLALQRTALANERTLLAYLRTALMLIAGGGTAIKLFGNPAAVVSGWLLIALGVATAVFGAYRFATVRRSCRQPQRRDACGRGERIGSTGIDS